MVPLLGLCGAVAPLSCLSISLARATPRRLCVPSFRLMGVVHTLSVYCAPSNLDCCFATVCPGVATSRLSFCWEQIGIITISITPLPTHPRTYTLTRIRCTHRRCTCPYPWRPVSRNPGRMATATHFPMSVGCLPNMSAAQAKMSTQTRMASRGRHWW